MSWNEPGGDNKDPWKSNKPKSKNEVTDKVTEFFEKLSSGGGKNLLLIGPLILLVLWVASGFYTIDAAERGVVLQFGKYSDTTTPGLHWVARPFQVVEIVNVDRHRTTSDRTTMLTKDENIVLLAVEVQYVVSDPKAYLFNVFLVDDERNQSNGVLYQAMRSAVREIVGRNKMDFILKEGRAQFEQDTHDLLQLIMNGYQSGLKINKINLTDASAPQEVKDAFDDANRAREDFDRSKNKAETYANKVLPEARGQAARAIEEATAYKSQVISKAEGEAERFDKLLVEYTKAPEVTRDRLYIDAMEKVLSGSKKVLIDTSSSNNVLYLPIGSDTTASNMPMPPIPQAQLDAQKNTSNRGHSNDLRQPREATSRESR